MDSKEFASKMAVKPVEERARIRNKLDSYIETGRDSNGRVLTGAQIEQFRLLARWLNLTLLSPVYSTEEVFEKLEKQVINGKRHKREL